MSEVKFPASMCRICGVRFYVVERVREDLVGGCVVGRKTAPSIKLCAECNTDADEQNRRNYRKFQARQERRKRRGA